VTLPGADHLVSQVYCSALPVAYSDALKMVWKPLATLVLEAAYEATLLAGMVNFAATGRNVVWLTRLGGGVFGNASHWIDAAIAKAISRLPQSGLDIRLVSHGGLTGA